MKRFFFLLMAVLAVTTLVSCYDDTVPSGETKLSASSAITEDNLKTEIHTTDPSETEHTENSAVTTYDESDDPETAPRDTSAEDEEVYADISFTFEDGVLTISGEGKMPDYYNTPWRDHSFNIEKIIIEEGITSIGALAFAHYNKLTSVEIPEGVVSIGKRAFMECHYIEQIIFPNTLEIIGDEAFNRCSSIKEINIPASVTSIGNMAFSGIRALTAVNVDERNEYYVDQDGVLFTRDMTEILAFPNKKTEVATEYKVPDGVKTIGSGAFQSCDIKKAELPESVISINENAFIYCYFLEECNIPNGVQTIGEFAFGSCPIINIVIPHGVTTIEAHAFAGCRTTGEVVIPETVKHIGNGALGFSGPHDQLIKIYIPAEVTDISSNAFGSYTNIESITYGGTIAEWSAFNIKLPQSGSVNKGTDFIPTVHCSDGDIIN